MNCKNCGNEIQAKANFCSDCGAKVINNRITFNAIFEDFITSLGWDNKYFYTLKSLILCPQIVLKEYLSGTRKKYINPFTFFAIGAAITVFVFTQFADDFIHISSSYITDSRKEQFYDYLNEKKLAEKGQTLKISIEDFKKEITEFQDNGNKVLLKYFNIFSFLLLPLYGYMTFLIFRKPYNYGEHFIINAYLQGITFIGVTVFFLTSLITTPNLYYFGTLFSLFYYIYAYKKLYRYTFKTLIIKLLKFIGIAILFGVISFFLGFLIGQFLR